MSRSRLIFYGIFILLLISLGRIVRFGSTTESTAIECCPSSSNILSNVIILPTNDLTASLLFPSGWITSNSQSVSFRVTTSDGAIKAGSLSNDGVNWGSWLPTTNGQLVSTTWNFGEDGIGKPVYLRLEDTLGDVVAVISNTVNVDLTAPVSSMTQLPPFSSRTFSISWSAIDITSGVASYDVQVRVGDTGSWADWLTSSSITHGVYDGAPGDTYYFRVRAKDLAGNIELWRTIDTMTSIPPTD